MFEISVTPFPLTTLTSPLLAITTTALFPSLSFVGTDLIPSKTTLPSNLALIVASTAILDAVPPTWNVLRVSCVPGSPID